MPSQTQSLSNVAERPRKIITRQRLPWVQPGAREVQHSPIDLDEFQELEASAFVTDEDIVYLRLSYERTCSFITCAAGR